MSIELGTATGIVGTVALLLFLWLNEKNIGFFLNSKSFFVALLASLLFAVFVETILSNSVVTYIITQLLGKDVTLTFRTVIYSMLPNIMKGRWLWGFGYGTGYLADLQGMSKSGPVMISLRSQEYLSLSFQPPEGF